MPRITNESVAVLTGASSGIGRATALEFARRGARLVLAARSRQQLQYVVSDCRELGAPAVAVPTDVTDESAVRHLADRALGEFGRIDAWVNNAAVTLFARFEDAPSHIFRRVIETNLFGYVHGARAVLPHFHRRGQGVLINVSSVVGKIGQPYTSAYVTSKFAILGFSECLRQELRDTNIDVCTVLPASIDTPLFQHGANYTGRAPKPMRPVYSAEKVACVIADTAERPQREAHAGTAAYLADLLRRVAPGLTERLVAENVERDHFQDHPAPETTGNLFEPMTELDAVGGGWRGDGAVKRRQRRSRRIGLAAGLLAVPAAVGWLAMKRIR